MHKIRCKKTAYPQTTQRQLPTASRCESQVLQASEDAFLNLKFLSPTDVSGIAEHSKIGFGEPETIMLDIDSA